MILFWESTRWEIRLAVAGTRNLDHMKVYRVKNAKLFVIRFFGLAIMSRLHYDGIKRRYTYVSTLQSNNSGRGPR